MTTLVLSGWTQPIDSLMHLADDVVLLDYSEYATVDAAIQEISKLKPSYVIGWSMGGNLALRAIASGRLTPKHLTLIAAPHRFVGVDGMGEETFRLFRESYANEPARTKARFHGLIAKGDRDMRRVIDMLGYHPDVENISRWLPWLDDLAAHTLDVSELASAPPTLMIHGMNDHIVPHAQSEYLARHMPHATLSSWAEVGHAPHLHDANRLRGEMMAHRKKSGVA